MASSGTIGDVAGNGQALRIAVEDLASHLATLEVELSGGRPIELVRGGVVVAEVRAVIASATNETPVPDFKRRLRDIWGEQPLEVNMTEVIREDRDSRG